MWIRKSYFTKGWITTENGDSVRLQYIVCILSTLVSSFSTIYEIDSTINFWNLKSIWQLTNIASRWMDKESLFGKS